MLYDLLPLLRGWRYKNIVFIPAGAITNGVNIPFSQLSGVTGAVIKGGSEQLDLKDDRAKDHGGWLLSVVFKASDASCKLTIHLDGESYEIMHIGAFEPSAPMPFHDLRIEVAVETTSSEGGALYYCAVNRIIIEDMKAFKESLQKLGLISLLETPKTCFPQPGG